MAIDPQRVKEIFLEATEQPDEVARAAYLDRTCGGDAALRDRVEALLRSHDPAGSFLGTPAAVVPEPNRGETMALDPNPGAGEAGAEQDDDLKFLTPSTRPDSLGRLGHYDVLQVLGKGGFGIVFRALDDMLQRVVAVKVMAPEIATLSPARKRFVREAQSSAKVRHENVVQVYEVGEQPLPYLVMEFIPGETLQQRLDRCGPLDVPEVLRIGRQIAEGLAAAHACDLIHRDIKPGNILLEGGSHKAKITDFGLARAADDASISQSGVVAGTPMFMSPEQALGHEIDQRADLFSLGSVLYQMASGRPPFRAPGALAVLKRVAEEPPRPIPEIIPETPDWLCGIIAKLHAKNPDERFQSAREVADLLADCEAKLKARQEVKSVLPPAVKPAAPTASGGWKWVAAAAVLLLPVLALTVTEFAGVTHLFRGQVATNPIKPDDGPHPVAKDEELPLADGWVRLFNGKDLTGWKTHPDQPGDWKVENGVLVGRGPQPSHLFSERADFSDFCLRVETSLTEKGESSVFVRSSFGLPFRVGSRGMTGGFGIGFRGDGASVHVGELSELGRSIGRKPLLARVAIPPETWFTMEIIAQGERYLVKVNGQITADYRDPQRQFSTGRVALQVFNADTIVQFRKIEIKELPPLSEALPPTFKNSIGMEFVIVPKGKSWLGGGKDKLGDKEVVIPADFYLGKYEVTQEEWEKVMGENPSHFPRKRPGKDAVKDILDADLKRFPVECVSWDHCQVFVAKLNQREKVSGWVYRLPTQLEWEYACRGGPMADRADSAFDFHLAKPTNNLSPDQANFGGRLKRTCKVGEYEANRLGLFDMHGNVTEWCDDKVDSEPAYRGGGWAFAFQKECRAAVPNPHSVRGFVWHNGLRLARVPSDAIPPEAKTPPADTKPTVDIAPAKPTAHDTWLKATALLPFDQHAAALAAKLKERLPGFEDAMLRTIRSMDADRQAIMVAAWLRDRNAAFESEIAHKIEGGVLTSLEMPSPLMQDLTPLRALPGLKAFTGRGTLGYDNQAARDAAVLRSLKTLETINGKSVAQFWKDAEARLAEFQEWLKLVPTLSVKQQAAAVAAKLKERNPGFDGVVKERIAGGMVNELTLNGENLTDLSPLRALEGLTVLKCTVGPLSDLSPLKGLPLTALDLGRTQVRDLSPLTGMPLTSLNLHATQVQNLEPLKGLPLTTLGLQFTKVQNLEPLKDMPLSRLHLNGCDQVRDLSPLKGMQLTTLEIYGCRPVRDLEPLKDMPLTWLHLGSCPEVRDLEVLKGMPLKKLLVNNTGVTDLKPLQALPLEYLRLTPKNITQGLDVLRDMKSLKTIGVTEKMDLPAAEFWARYDKGEFK